MPGRTTTYIQRITSGIRHLKRVGGLGQLSAITGIWDSVTRDASAAQSERMLRECSDETLPYHARNSGDRQMLGETYAELRAHLNNRWGWAKRDGTEDGMQHALSRLHLTGEFWSYQRLKLAGVPANVAFGGIAQRAFFFVILRHPHPFIAGPEWDGGEDWDGGASWGLELVTGGDLDQFLSEIRYALMKHRAAGESPRFLVIDLDGSTTVKTTAPYDFEGNYVVIPLFEDSALVGRPAPVPFYNYSFVNP